MSSSRTPRRSDTRQRIQEVALELFAEQGYEKTSLREIAERLEVTKAALYYHFRTKEDILIALYEDLTRPLEELVIRAREQPPTLETKKETLRHYSERLQDAASLFRFFHENQGALRELRIGGDLKQRMKALGELMCAEDASLVDRMRCMGALFTLHAGMFGMAGLEASLDERRRAALQVAIELVTASHPAAEQ
jgi:AcrR family transcriptional regulator